MFLDDKSIKYKNNNLLSSTLKGNVIQQAALKLVEHVTLNRNFYHTTHNNNNGNAFDDYHQSSIHIQPNNKHLQRTDKCNSWLSNVPRKSDTSLNRLPIYIKSQLYNHKSRVSLSPIRMHQQPNYSHFPINQSHYIPLSSQSNQLHLSSNTLPNDINPEYNSLSQPLILVHKKRLHRDHFLSTMQNCIQPPYSQNHFYAFDQINMLKLQRNFHSTKANQYHSNLKRKYFDLDNNEQSQCDCSNIQQDRISLSKQQNQRSPMEDSSPKTADHVHINKYHDENKTNDQDVSVDNEKCEQSNLIVSHLEKILNLCTELRSLAKDVEIQLNEQTNSTANNDDKKTSIEFCPSEQTTLNISKEFDIEPMINDPPPYEIANDTLSLHSESQKSHPLMLTESFKTKSPSLTNSHTTLRKTEDICSCFLKSYFDKENCHLNIDEQQYLNELTKAYLLGRQHYEANEKLQNENQLEEQQQSNHDLSSKVIDKNENNNNPRITPISPSSVLFYNNFQKSDDHLSTIPEQSNESIISLVEDDRQQLLTSAEILSFKHQTFIHEPIAMKTTHVLPGIGNKYAKQLGRCGFTKVRRLLGFYLMVKNDQNFVAWLNSKAGLSSHSAWLCTKALRSWCEVHL